MWRPPTQLVEDVFVFSVPLQLTHLRCYDHALYKLTFYLLTYLLTLSVGSVSEILSILSYVEKIDEFESTIFILKFVQRCVGDNASKLGVWAAPDFCNTQSAPQCEIFTTDLRNNGGKHINVWVADCAVVKHFGNI